MHTTHSELVNLSGAVGVRGVLGVSGGVSCCWSGALGVGGPASCISFAVLGNAEGTNMLWYPQSQMKNKNTRVEFTNVTKLKIVCCQEEKKTRSYGQTECVLWPSGEELSARQPHWCPTVLKRKRSSWKNILKCLDKHTLSHMRWNTKGKMADLPKVFGSHVSQGLSSDSVVSYDWQVVLSGEFTQHIPQIPIHSRFLRRKERTVNFCDLMI